ncbi:MAG: hypothetical protein ACLRSW_05490 [Christensenellaceae bacterium]
MKNAMKAIAGVMAVNICVAGCGEALTGDDRQDPKIPVYRADEAFRTAA